MSPVGPRVWGSKLVAPMLGFQGPRGLTVLVEPPRPVL